MIIIVRVLLMFFYIFINSFNNQGKFVDGKEITLEKTFLIEKTSYCVLFYLPECPSCKVIFDYIDQCLENNTDIYYINLETLENENRVSQQNNVGQNDYHEIRINISPTLLQIENNYIVNQIEGMENIHNYLELNYYLKASIKCNKVS